MSGIDFEQQRKRAKELRRAHAAGSRDAAERIARHLPRARGRSVEQILAAKLVLAEAQLVVAREAGFASWPAMKRAVAAADAETAEARLVEAALRGDAATVEALRGAATSVYAAAVLGEPSVDLEDRRGGPRGWTPLLYLCCARYPRTGRRAEIAQRMLDAGADLDAVGLTPGFTSENVGVFADYKWRPIEGAAGCAVELALVELLLARGANLAQTSRVLTCAVAGGDPAILKALLAAEPPWWQRIWALKACSELERVELAKLLVERAERPQLVGPALDDAIRMHRDPELVRVIAATATDPANQIWQTAYRTATRHGNADALAALQARGITAPLSPIDRAIAACIAGESADPITGLSDDDHRMLAWAIRTGRHAAVAPLLALGVDPDVADVDGARPLHLAVAARSQALVDQLLAAGATIDARDYEARTPLDLADAALGERLLAAGASPAKMTSFRAADDSFSERLHAAGAVERDDADALFERAADAVAFGDLATLRELLDDEPALVHARSPRPHRATLLHYCGANGTEDPRQRTPDNAPAIAALLLERGADPDATCKLYDGPSTTMSLLLTSAIPLAAKLDGELVRVLARHGATITRADLAGAILYGMPLAVAALVEAGVPVDDLLAAAGTGRVDLIAALLAAGADIDARFQGGCTALHAAAAMNQEVAARFLLAHGADRTLRDHGWDNTPAGWARHYEHAALVALLDAA